MAIVGAIALPLDELDHLTGRRRFVGFDVCGLKPKSRTGQFFGASITYWTPIWDYVAATCSDLLTEEQIMEGYANDGVRIRATQAEDVGKRLKKLLRSGETAEYIAKHKKHKKKPKTVALVQAQKLMKALGGHMTEASFDEGAVRKFANFCIASGGFEID